MTPAVSRCLIRREPDLVTGWLQTLPATAEEAALVRGGESRFAACFDPYAQAAGGWLESYDAASMRPALVRAILQSRRDSLPREPDASADRQPWYRVPENPPPETVSAIVAADLGLCLARKDWADVIMLIEVVDPSVERVEMMGAQRRQKAMRKEDSEVSKILPKFIPNIAGCLPEGLKLRLDSQRLKDIIDEAAYHLIVR